MIGQELVAFIEVEFRIIWQIWTIVNSEGDVWPTRRERIRPSMIWVNRLLLSEDISIYRPTLLCNPVDSLRPSEQLSNAPRKSIVFPLRRCEQTMTPQRFYSCPSLLNVPFSLIGDNMQGWERTRHPRGSLLEVPRKNGVSHISLKLVVASFGVQEALGTCQPQKTPRRAPWPSFIYA